MAVRYRCESCQVSELFVQVLEPQWGTQIGAAGKIVPAYCHATLLLASPEADAESERQWFRYTRQELA